MDTKRVIEYFYEISRYPRPSKQEERVVDFLEKWSKERKFSVIRDSSDNLIITAPGDKDGYIALQAHTDMVCVSSVGHDFEKSGINILEKDGELKAKDTTLGADNGIGIALAMAATDLEDRPTLELVFTTDEERGMSGAKNIDLSALKSETLINLDEEDVHSLCVGSAGGDDICAQVPISRSPAQFSQYRIRVHGLKGGHSGVDIHKPVGNAILMISALLLSYQKGIQIVSVDGGQAMNAIPVSCEAIVGIESLDEFLVFSDEICLYYRQNYDAPNVEIEIQKCSDAQEVISDAEPLLRILLQMGSGVVKWLTDKQEDVQTSFNLGKILTQSDSVEVSYMSRSCLQSDLDTFTNTCKTIYGEENLRMGAHIPVWESDTTSKYLHSVLDLLQKINPDIEMKKVHAGLETAIFAEKYPELQLISIGPTITAPHTIHESIKVEDIEMVWKYLAEIVKRIK